MTCCKCIEHKWGDPQPIEYVDDEGKGYCLFHAPANHKMIDGCTYLSVAAFNTFVFHRIDQVISKSKAADKNYPCTMAGIVFLGSISFGSYNNHNPLPSISFNNAKSLTNTCFDDTTFGGEAHFINAEFGKGASFSKTTFEKGAYFAKAAFGEGAIFSNVTFSGWAVFIKATFGEGANFSAASFGKGPYFSNATFGEGAAFADATFGKNANFYKATFGKVPNFSKATFGEEANFAKATFGKEANFAKATFGEWAHFSSASFGQGAIFDNASFGNFAALDKTSFGEGSKFFTASFGEWVDFANATFGEGTLFIKTSFGQEASFNAAIFGFNVNFRHAEFKGRTSFQLTTLGGGLDFGRATFKGEPDFGAARFTGSSSFREARFVRNGKFTRTIFTGEANFQDVKAKDNALRLHALRAGSLANLSFTSLETELFSFKGCDWPEMLLPEADGLQSGKDCKGVYRDNKACEELYRSLKQKAAAEHDQPMTSWWHFREKLMKLEGVKIRYPKLWHLHWLGLYWLLCGFGERWVPPLKALAGMLLFCLLLLGLGGVHGGGFVIQGPALPTRETFQDFGSVCLSLLKYLLLIKEESIEFRPIYGLAEFLILLFTRLIIPIQAAFFAIALRNAYRR